MFSLPAIVLRDHLVLCDADRLQVLNPTARRLWEILREIQDESQAVAWLVDTYGLSAAQAKRDIAALFNPAPPQEPLPEEDSNLPAQHATFPDSRREKRLADSAAPQAGANATRGWKSHYRIFDRPFSLRCATADLARAIEPLFAHLRVETAAGPWFELEDHNDGFTGWRDHELRFETATLDGAVTGVFKEILHYACSERDCIATLHAGAVSDGRTCLVLAAACARGKSTLTAALLARGYRYLSDDVTPLERGSGHAIPAPVCLNLKPGSIPVLAELYPELPDLPAWRSGNRRLRFLPPPEFARRLPERAYPVAALVFPRYQPNATPELHALDPITVLTELVASDTLFERPLDPARIGELCAWIEATPAYALRYGDLATAVDAVTTVWP